MRTVIIRNYSFDKAAKTVTFTDFTDIELSRVISITNCTRNVQMFHYKFKNFGGSVSSNVLTLNYTTDNNSFENTDELLIEYDLEGHVEIIVPSAEVVATGQTSTLTSYTRGAEITIDVSAIAGGAPEVVFKVQSKDHVTDWVDVTGAATATVSGVAKKSITIYPGIEPASNEKVSAIMPRQYRLAWTFAGTTDSVTFSAAIRYIE